MTETAVENGIVDGARADNSEAEFNTADEAVHSAHNNVAELESEDAMNQQPKASTVLSMPPTAELESEDAMNQQPKASIVLSMPPTAELESEDAMNQQPKASTVLSMPPTHCQELNSEGLQEASSQCEVSGSLSTATGQ